MLSNFKLHPGHLNIVFWVPGSYLILWEVLMLCFSRQVPCGVQAAHSDQPSLCCGFSVSSIFKSLCSALGSASPVCARGPCETWTSLMFYFSKCWIHCYSWPDQCVHSLGWGQELITTSLELQLSTVSLVLAGSSGSPFQSFIWNAGVCMPCCVMCFHSQAQCRAKRQEVKGLPSSRWWGRFPSRGSELPGGPPLPAWPLPGDPFSAPQVWTRVFLALFSERVSVTQGWGVGANSLRVWGSYTSGRVHRLPVAVHSPGLSWLLCVFCPAFQAAFGGSRGVGVLTQCYLEPDSLVHIGVCVNRYVYRV